MSVEGRWLDDAKSLLSGSNCTHYAKPVAIAFAIYEAETFEKAAACVESFEGGKQCARILRIEAAKVRSIAGIVKDQKV